MLAVVPVLALATIAWNATPAAAAPPSPTFSFTPAGLPFVSRGSCRGAFGFPTSGPLTTFTTTGAHAGYIKSAGPTSFPHAAIRIEILCHHAFGTWPLDLSIADDDSIGIPIWHSSGTVCHGDSSTNWVDGGFNNDSIPEAGGPWSRISGIWVFTDNSGADSDFLPEWSLNPADWLTCIRQPAFKGGGYPSDTGGGFMTLHMQGWENDTGEPEVHVDTSPTPHNGAIGWETSLCHIIDVTGPAVGATLTSGEEVTWRVDFQEANAVGVRFRATPSADLPAWEYDETFDVPPASSPVEVTFTPTETGAHAWTAACVSENGEETDFDISLDWESGPEFEGSDELFERLEECLSGIGIGWNPASWVPALLKGSGCLLSFVFVPTSSQFEDIGDTLADGYNDSGISAIGDTGTALVGAGTGFFTAAGAGGACEGPAIALPLGGGGDTAFEPLTTCPGTGGAQFAPVVKNGLAVLVIAGGVFAAIRMLQGAFGVADVGPPAQLELFEKGGR